MKFLSVFGSAAMLLLGSRVLAHGVPAAGHALADYAASLGWAGVLVSSLGNAVAGLVAGLLVLGTVQPFQGMRSAKQA